MVLAFSFLLRFPDEPSQIVPFAFEVEDAMLILDGVIGLSFDWEGWRIASERRKADTGARARDLAPPIRDLQAQGLSLRRIASTFDGRAFRTHGGGKWTATQVSRFAKR
jgi:hypothetical protein